MRTCQWAQGAQRFGMMLGHIGRKLGGKEIRGRKIEERVRNMFVCCHEHESGRLVETGKRMEMKNTLDEPALCKSMIGCVWVFFRRVVIVWKYFSLGRSTRSEKRNIRLVFAFDKTFQVNIGSDSFEDSIIVSAANSSNTIDTNVRL